jgi:hypothetical protein
MRGWQKVDRDLCRGMATFLVCLFFLSGTLHATVTSKVLLADANTPLGLADPNVLGVYKDIMVGTHLTIIISSDTGGEEWLGDLLIGEPYLGKGLLSARDYNDITTKDWQGSRFPAAGKEARVMDWPIMIGQGRLLEGFGLQASRDSEIVAGDWFILDYKAVEVGQCVVELTDYSVSFDEPVSVQVFSHVPTRDFDKDGKVCLVDFALLAGVWKAEFSVDPDDPNPQYDLNSDGKVNVSDLRLFFGHWLDTTQ